ncbi:HNH endonuclease [Litoribacter alkaliphilus]|uniref:HNH endonuclease n=1 Tax=Litoribacter ruber TaxID=702568 RepID=A0AAP2G5U8_9BACT|nr:HNH endonuclease [Litoribacter alkaliphilus]MBS9525905.1 HNH endonuclease [Litoribacter alkaliphilus]
MKGDDLLKYPNNDSDWSEEHWKNFIEYLIEDKFFTYKQLASGILGQLNPPQVGTGTTEIVKHHYPPRKAWQNVKNWFYSQSGRCEDCGTRLDLQTDHVIPRQELGVEADRLDNFLLRCRRCNVVRRPSHKNGGVLNLTSSSALMWILLTRRPKTYPAFEKLCRDYGMKMASIRFQEAWALAIWLEKEGEYEIDK